MSTRGRQTTPRPTRRPTCQTNSEKREHRAGEEGYEIKDGDGEETETRLIPMLREYTVFNIAQCEGLPDSVKLGKPMRVRNPDTRDALADEFLRSTSAWNQS
jgi:antirestriction protein ArdC